MSRGTNHSPRGVTGDTDREQKAQVGRHKAPAITSSTGLRRRERRFESCRGHHPLTSGYHFRLPDRCLVWRPHWMSCGTNSIHGPLHDDLAPGSVLEDQPRQLRVLLRPAPGPRFESRGSISAHCSSRTSATGYSPQVDQVDPLLYNLSAHRGSSASMNFATYSAVCTRPWTTYDAGELAEQAGRVRHVRTFVRTLSAGSVSGNQTSRPPDPGGSSSQPRASRALRACRTKLSQYSSASGRHAIDHV